jgi:hypothetical protein
VSARRAITRVAFPAAAALGLGWPSTAAAHGLARRSTLPLPAWMFGLAAAAVLVVSFVALAALWTKPRWEDPPPWRPLPAVGRLLGSRAVDVACGAIGVALTAVVILAGYLAPQSAFDNLAPTAILIWFWVGTAFASVLFGEVFRAFSPWRALGRALRLTRARVAYPAHLGRWPAALGLLAFGWIELASGWGEEPARLVSAALAYSVVTLGCMAAFGTETWHERGEAFGVFFGALARMSVWEQRERVVGVRPPLRALSQLETGPGVVGFVLVAIGTITFDGLSAGPVWVDVSGTLTDTFGSWGLSESTAGVLAADTGLLFGVALCTGIYLLGIEGMRMTIRGHDTSELARMFVHSLVPIAFAYLAAHYLSFLLVEGQAIAYLANDPFGQGWNLLGTGLAGIDYEILSQELLWYLQVGFVVAGHVAGLALAHDRALARFGTGKEGVRSQYWMLGAMVCFTLLALTLLAEAGS